MKLRFMISMAMVFATISGYCPPRFGVMPYEASPQGLSVYQQQQAAYELQQQQALIAAQKAAAEKAAWEKFRDAKMDELAKERDAALAALHHSFDPDLVGLEAQMAPLEQRAKNLEILKRQSEAQNDALQAKQMFKPKDPWRLIEGEIDCSKNTNWYQFTGVVLGVRTNGILIQGDFGLPAEAGFGERRYFVENFPNDKYALADNEEVTKSMNFVAHLGGKTTFQFTSSTMQTGVETVRRLDYGQIVETPPAELVSRWQNQIPIMGGPDPEILTQIASNDGKLAEIKSRLTPAQGELELQADKIKTAFEARVENLPNVYAQYLRDKANEKKVALLDKVLKSNQESADKGDVYGLLRMGERYRDGEGVGKNLIKAREYLTKAAAAGSPTAADELAKLQ